MFYILRARTKCTFEASQVLFAYGQVVFHRDLSYLPLSKD